MRALLKQRKVKSTSLITLDFISILISYYAAYAFGEYFKGEGLGQAWGIYIENIRYILMASGVYILFLVIYKQYKSMWTLSGVSEFLSGLMAIITGYIVNAICIALSIEKMEPTIAFLAGVFILTLCMGVRVVYRELGRRDLFEDSINYLQMQNILVVGAGSSGAILINEFVKHKKLGKKVVALIDDDKEKLGTYLLGVKVVGNRYDIEKVVLDKNISEIVIAIANLDKKDLDSIISKCKETKLPVKIMPAVSEIIDNKFTLNNIRDIDVEDLLGREAVRLDYDNISEYLEGKVVLVTGGGGSIGSELCRQIARFRPKKLIIFDIYENNAYEIQNELLRNYKNLDLLTLIGSVRDRKRLKEVYETYNPNVVFHAAAHKHVPLMEESPAEAIKNNVMGTFNVAEFANNFRVDRFVLISTDKAVNPTNIMGATKRVCEMIIQAFDKESDTEFVAVRFGNVLGSNGSVVPLFKKQIANGGPVTLTHKEITRYFMTIPEASQLVLQAGAFASGGEIFVLDMGQPVKIYDLAENIIKLSGFEPHKDIEIKITGLRPGEKLYEELLMEEEGLEKTNHKKIFIGKPSTLNLEDIINKINKLMDIAVDGDKELIKVNLKEIVTTYKEPHEVNNDAVRR